MIPLVLYVLLPVLVAAIAYFLPSKGAKTLALLLETLLVILTVLGFYQVAQDGTIIETLGGWPAHIGITLRADRLAVVMLMLGPILILAMILFDGTRNYMNTLFLFLFLLIQGLYNGVILTRDLFNMFVMLEVATILISILIMFKKNSQAMYDGLYYFMLNAVAMLFFLFGTGILYRTLGVLDLESIAAGIQSHGDRAPFILPYAFIITAACLKAAIGPLYAWLPKAHGTASAPGSVSALLSGLYVKLGLYLFLRIQAAFEPVLNTADLFLLLGFVTAVMGFIYAISQTDLKLILAYSTISQVGLIMMALNMDSFRSYWGGIFHILNHAVFKSSLFLCAGLIVDEYGMRDVHQIRGVLRRMPFIGCGVILSIFGIVGAPFFNGSLSKYWIAYGMKDTLGEFGLYLVNLGTMLIFIKFSTILFGGRGSRPIRTDPVAAAASISLGLLCFLGGLFGQQFIYLLFDLRLPVDPISYGAKMGIFLLTFLAGFLLYHGLVKRWKLFHTIRRLEMSFNTACMAILAFFGFMVLYLRYIL